MQKLLAYILPNSENPSKLYSVVMIAVGGFVKYVFGGVFLDYLGHLLIFIGCLNFLYLIRYHRREFNDFLIGGAFLVALFVIAQLGLHRILIIWFDITPIFQE